MSAKDILMHMRLPGEAHLYVLGCFEQRVTLYSQQVRALNLVDALAEQGVLLRDSRVAVVGGGAAGLTAAAGALVLGARVTLFERKAQLLSLQRGTRTRHLHPHIYDWPHPGADERRAGLPLLDWSANSATEVAGVLHRAWDAIIAADCHKDRFQAYLEAADLEIPSTPSGPYTLTWGPSYGMGEFDIVIVAVGFGEEQAASSYPTAAVPRYWDDDDLEKERSSEKTFLVSGCGDGGLIDVLRIRLSDFEQANLIKDFLAGPEEAAVRDRLLEIERSDQRSDSAWLTREYIKIKTPDIDRRLQARIRKARSVTLNGAGKHPLLSTASMLNRFIVSRFLNCPAGNPLGMAYRAGKIVSVTEGCVEFEGEPARKGQFDRLVIRHGPRPALSESFAWMWGHMPAMRARNALDQTRARAFRADRFAPRTVPEIGTPPSRHEPESHPATGLALSGKGYRSENLRSYLDHVIEQFAILDLRGLSGAAQGVSIPLESVYVELQAEADNPTERDYDRRLVDLDLLSQLGQIDLDRAESSNVDEQVNRILASDPYALRLRQNAHDAQGRPTLETATSIPIAELVRRHRRAIVLGDPGSGKTTLLRFLALQHGRALANGAERTLVNSLPRMSAPEDVEDVAPEDLGPVRLPIYVRIAEYAEARRKDRQLSLLSFLPAYWVGQQTPVEADALQAIFADFLDRRRALLLFDGLDEISSLTERRDVVRQIENFVRAQVPVSADPLTLKARLERSAMAEGNQVIITSRIAGYHAAPLQEAIAHHIVCDMSDDAIELFLERWALAVEERRNPDSSETERRRRAIEQVSSLRQELDRPGVKRLAVNPLLLTLLALLQRGEGRLPRLRIDLYRNATRTLIETWRSSSLKEDEVIDVIGPVALWIHTHRPSGFATEAELLDLVKDALAKWRGEDPKALPPSFRTEVHEFLDAVRRESGLVLARGEGLYGFAHLTFQEYFVAREISRSPAELALIVEAHITDPRWREPLLLAFAQIAKEVRGQLSALFERAQQISVKHEDLLHRRLLFLAATLPECAWVPPEAAKSICEQLVRAYAVSRSSARLQPLRARIEAAFQPLGNSEAARRAEEALVAAIASDETALMAGAATLIVATKGLSPRLMRMVRERSSVWWLDDELRGSYLDLEMRCVWDLAPGEGLVLRTHAIARRNAWVQLSSDPRLSEVLLLACAPLSMETADATESFEPESIHLDGPFSSFLQSALQATDSRSALLDVCRSAWEERASGWEYAGLLLLVSGSLQFVPAQQATGVRRAIGILVEVFQHVVNRNWWRVQGFERVFSEPLAVAAKRLSSMVDVKGLLASDAIGPAEIRWLASQPLASIKSRMDRTLLRLAACRFAVEEMSAGEAGPLVDVVELPGAWSRAHLRAAVRRLNSPDDAIRAEAQKELERVRRVSDIGARTVIELHRQLACVDERAARNPGYIGTVLTNACHSIVFDDAKVLGAWIRGASKAPTLSPTFKGLLSRLSRLSAAALSTLCAELEHASSGVQVSLLQSLQHFVRHGEAVSWDVIEPLTCRLYETQPSLRSWCLELAFVRCTAGEGSSRWGLEQLRAGPTPEEITGLTRLLGGAGSRLSAALAAQDQLRAKSDEMVEFLDGQLAKETKALTVKDLVDVLWNLLPAGADELVKEFFSYLEREGLDAQQIALRFRTWLEEPAADLPMFSDYAAELGNILNELHRLLNIPEARIAAGASLAQILIQEDDLNSGLTQLSELLSSPEEVLLCLHRSLVCSSLYSEVDGHAVTAAAQWVTEHPPLLARLWRIIEISETWPERNPALAILAAIAELSPALVNRELSVVEPHLLAFCGDINSFSIRQLSLSVLSRFRRLGPGVGEVLLRACSDVDSVEGEAFDAAQRFQHFEPSSLGPLYGALIGGSSHAAHGAALVLSELCQGRQVLETPGLRDTITDALSVACVHESSERIVNGAPLAVTFYEALARACD